MIKMKKLAGIVIAISLSGCSITPPTQLQQSSSFDDIQFRSDSGIGWTVNGLKADYKSVTGKNLIVPEAASCQWDRLCYYNAYAKAHDGGIRKFNDAKQKAEEAKCAANPKCARDKVIQQEQERLNNVYSLIIVQNPYLQADYDQAVRMMCRKAGELQRNGMSLEQMRKNISVVEGIAPGDRRNIQEIAESCWKLSAAGVKNGSELIGNPYQSSERMTFAY